MPRIIPICDLKNTTKISRMCNESAEPSILLKMVMVTWLLWG